MEDAVWTAAMAMIRKGVSAREAALRLSSTYGRLLYSAKAIPSRSEEYRDALTQGRLAVLAAFEAERVSRGCSVPGCLNPHRCRGLCQLHYSRWCKGRDDDSNLGPAERLTYKADGLVCISPGCDAPVRCRSLCALHYGRSIIKNTCPACGGDKTYRSALCQPCRVQQKRSQAPLRRCTGCNTEKAIDQFAKTKGSTGKIKRHAQCRPCRAGHSEAARKANLARRLRNDRVFRVIHEAVEAKHPLAPLLRSVRTSAVTLGLDPETILHRFLQSGNVCEACGKTCGTLRQQRVYLDHCHKTGAFRGFLCQTCNTVAGQVDDCTSRLGKIITYLNTRTEGSIFTHLDV